jgi:hypothetical protein
VRVATSISSRLGLSRARRTFSETWSAESQTTRSSRAESVVSAWTEIPRTSSDFSARGSAPDFPIAPFPSWTRRTVSVSPSRATSVKTVRPPNDRPMASPGPSSRHRAPTPTASSGHTTDRKNADMQRGGINSTAGTGSPSSFGSRRKAGSCQRPESVFTAVSTTCVPIGTRGVRGRRPPSSRKSRQTMRASAQPKWSSSSTCASATITSRFFSKSSGRVGASCTLSVVASYVPWTPGTTRFETTLRGSAPASSRVRTGSPRPIATGSEFGLALRTAASRSGSASGSGAGPGSFPHAARPASTAHAATRSAAGARRTALTSSARTSSPSSSRPPSSEAGCRGRGSSSFPSSGQSSPGSPRPRTSGRG